MDTSVVREWLYQVERDLLSALNCARAPEPTTDRAAFLIQQAAEKLVKAALIAHGIEFRRTHDVAELVDDLPGDAPQRPLMVPLARFTDYATVFRYPSEQQEEPIPTVADIEAWADEIRLLKIGFERWLEQRAGEPG
jgi:HEPN domain-containing protein